MTEERTNRRLAAILAADVVGYSRLMGEDETGTLAALKQHRSALIDPTVAEYRGRVVKLVGDGTLVEFASAVDAVECAVAIQRGMLERNAGVPENRRIMLRIGINVGDVIIDGDDIYGDGVNVAARLEGLCKPTEICVSAAIYDQVTGKIDTAFEDIGEQTLKNISRPVRTYRVRPMGHGILRSTAVEESNSPKLPNRPSIAVMPFDCYPVDAEQEAFANGMTEDLTTDLSKVAGLFVVARYSAQAIKAQTSELRQIATALGVRYVLEGSVRKSGERVRINAQLIVRRQRLRGRLRD